MRQKMMISKKLCLIITGLLLLTGCGSSETEEISEMTETESSVMENSQSETIESSIILDEESDEVYTFMDPKYEIENGYCDGDLYGVLKIEDVNIEVPLYYTSVFGDGASAQEIIDRVDSAGYFRYGEQHLIGDHDYQGFVNLLDVKEGTEATIEVEKGYSITYKCIKLTTGVNRGRLYDADKKDLADQNPGGITLYTCNGSTEDVFICLFEQVVK